MSLAAALDGDSRECDVVLTLESGDRLSLGGEFVSAWCTAVPPTPLLFGYRDDVLDNKGWSGGQETSPSLIVSGLDGDVRWIGIAVHNPHLDTPAPDPCYHLYLGRANGAHGAWLEGDRVHLDNGPVLPLSPGFRMNTNYPEPWPLRGSDYLCLDVEGRVTYATTPAGS